MLLSLVTHADRYEIMVGAHNTVDAQRYVGGLTVWELMAPTIL